ncbi:MAG: hypothetical protein RMJ67_01285 [Elusimicrobiota bacterium]|nr:hypothetical protein [Endomicrobiia bacterium]MDW8165137.1 hypothetical protein [Elusimicrobiota bacterium]
MKANGRRNLDTIHTIKDTLIRNNNKITYIKDDKIICDFVYLNDEEILFS